MDAWAEIRQLDAEGKTSRREIARRVGVSRGTVERALAADRLPKYERPPRASRFDVFAPRVRALLAKTPSMPASTLAERVDWPGSSSLFRAKVALLRPEYVLPDPADRLVHSPGVQVQCDLWFPRDPIPLGHGQADKPPVLVMTSMFAGFVQALMLPSRQTPDLLGGMWTLIGQAGAVPKQLLWDNETGIGRGKLTKAAAAFAGVLGTKITLAPPRDPETKGMVERMNRFFRGRFMPGRTFTSPQDFNTQLELWLPKGNARWSRSRRGKPTDLIAVDRQAMHVLPPVAPDVLFTNTVRLPRDYYVRVFSNDYSVDPAMIGRIVDVRASLDTVSVSHDGVPVTTHQRSWAHGLTITDPAHVAKAAVLRKAFQESKRRHRPTPVLVQARELASYDAVFGVDIGAEEPAAALVVAS